MTTAKNDVFIGLQLEIFLCSWRGGNCLLVRTIKIEGGARGWGDNFSSWGDERIFGW